MTRRSEHEVLFAYTGTQMGGSFVSSSLLAQYVSQIPGWRAYACLPRHGDNTPVFEHAGVEMDFLDVPRRDVDALATGRFRSTLVLRLKYCLRAYNYLARKRPDIVHINDTQAMTIWGPTAKLLGIPVVFHVRSEMRQRLDPLFLWSSDYLIFVAGSNRERFAKRGQLPPNSVVYNPVDFNQFHPAKEKETLRGKLGLPANRTIIGFVGTLEHRKRPEWAVQACIDLLHEGHNLHCIVIGEDRSRSYHESFNTKATEANQRDRFSFLGLRYDVPDLMRAMDILVLCSRTRGEAFPRVVIEAMSSGVPVVATDVAGVSEAIQQGVTGLLANPDDYGDFRSQIRTLLENQELRHSIAARGLAEARRRFSVSRLGDEVISIYRSLLSETEESMIRCQPNVD